MNSTSSRFFYFLFIDSLNWVCNSILKKRKSENLISSSSIVNVRTFQFENSQNSESLNKTENYNKMMKCGEHHQDQTSSPTPTQKINIYNNKTRASKWINQHIQRKYETWEIRWLEKGFVLSAVTWFDRNC